MGRFGNAVKALFGVQFSVPGPASWGSTQDWLRGLDIPGQTGLSAPYAQHPTIALCLDLVSRDGASVEWEVFPRGVDDPDARIDDHPILRAFASPGPGLTGRDLWTLTYLQRMLFGEAFWYYPDLILGSTGRTLKVNGSGGIAILDPRAVRSRRNADGTLAWTYEPSGQKIVLDADRLTQFKRINPYDGVRGQSQVEPILGEACADWAAAEWNRRFFSENNGIPTLVLIPGDTGAALMMTSTQREEFLQRWKTQHANKRNVGAIPAGWDIKDFSISQKDMDFRSLREYSRELIMAQMGVPPFIAGVLDKANYANARAQSEVYWKGTISRMLIEVQATLNADFLPKVGAADIDLFPCWEQVKALTEDLAAKTAMADTWMKIGIPKREINERLEMGWDIDEIEDADQGYVATSLQTIENASAPPPAPMALPGPGGAANLTDPAVPPPRALTLVTGEKSAASTRLTWRSHNAARIRTESRFEKLVRSHFNALERETLDNLYGMKGYTAKQIEDPERVIFDLATAQAEIARRSQPAYEAAMVSGNNSLELDIASVEAVNFLSPRVIARVTQLTNRIKDIDVTVQQLLREELSAGISAGESIDEIAKRVQSVFDVSRARARAIARTENGVAFNTSRNEGMKENGINQHRWITQLDDVTREDHRKENGNVVAIGEHFPETGLYYPNDPAGPAAQVINCRCLAVPVTWR